MSAIPGAPPSTPADRLALSRLRLRQAMRPPSAPPGSAGSPHPHAHHAALAWLDSLKALPGVGVLIDAVARAWAQHPLRVASLVAADAAQAVVRPVAQNNPIGLVLGALALGGLLAWSRPWRWLLTPALLAGLMPQLFSKAMALVPPSSWMVVLTSLLKEQGRPRAEASSPAPTSAPEPSGQGPDQASMR